jgi:2-iminobutanoate/2-iminopropanoate deaminase
MSTPQPIQPQNMPKALGPYSHVVRLGDTLYVAGQGGLNPATGQLAGEGFEAQARQAFENLSTILQAANSSLQHVAKTTIFLTDASNFAKLNELYAEFFPNNPPARSVPVVQLPRGLLISVECIAGLSE